MRRRLPASGMPLGLDTGTLLSSSMMQWYTTEGAVMMRSRSYSLSRRSRTMSMCSSPRKPQRKPKPRLEDICSQGGCQPGMGVAHAAALPESSVVCWSTCDMCIPRKPQRRPGPGLRISGGPPIPVRRVSPLLTGEMLMWADHAQGPCAAAPRSRSGSQSPGCNTSADMWPSAGDGLLLVS